MNRKAKILEKKLQNQVKKDGMMKGDDFWPFLNELFYEKFPEERPTHNLKNNIHK